MRPEALPEPLFEQGPHPVARLGAAAALELAGRAERRPVREHRLPARCDALAAPGAGGEHAGAPGRRERAEQLERARVLAAGALGERLLLAVRLVDDER